MKRVLMYCRDIKDMNSNQAKASVETAKEVMNDKTLRTKGDKDRRLREKKQQNTKKFLDERKTMDIKQNREKEKVKVTHEKQVKDLDKDIDGVSSWCVKKNDNLSFLKKNNAHLLAEYRNVHERGNRIRFFVQGGILYIDFFQ